VSNASELLPEPLTPVITISLFFGSLSETSRRLCSRAPRMTISCDSELALALRGFFAASFFTVVFFFLVSAAVVVVAEPVPRRAMRRSIDERYVRRLSIGQELTGREYRTPTRTAQLSRQGRDSG
jgi:hypothetical protein